jgi:hypothetical protein
MPTIVPRLEVAIRLAGVRPAAVAAGSPAYAPGGTGLLIFLLAIIAIIIIVRINGLLVGLVSQLLQLATAVGFSLLMIILVGGLLIVVLLHG